MIEDIDPNTRKTVFIAFGKDTEVKESVARYVQRLDLIPVLLEEETDGGKTVIEKLEEHSPRAGYAIILLTADDRGGSKETSIDTYKFRARQNVIMELGWFMNGLGRSNVCIVAEPNVEIPSNVRGVLYVDRNDGDWKMKIAKNMKAAGMDVDLNKLA